jgi:DNA-binding beta-propeller fold protein YncE
MEIPMRLFGKILIVVCCISALSLMGCSVSPEMSSEIDQPLDYAPAGIWDGSSDGIAFDRTLGIATDSQGRVYAPAGKDSVIVFSADGKILDTWGKGFKGKHGLRIFDDKVWVTELKNHVVRQYTLDGKLLMTLGTKGKSGTGKNQFNKPSDVAVAPNGDIYVSDGYANTRVMRFTPDGKFKQSWGTKGKGPGQFDLVHNIAIDSKGRVYVADRNNKRVQIFDADGKFLDQWTHLGRPYGLYVDDKTRVYVVDGKSNNVYVTNSKGQVLTMFGKTGTGAGEFDMSHSITVDKQGSIYIAEGDGRRIQKFTIRKQ